MAKTIKTKATKKGTSIMKKGKKTKVDTTNKIHCPNCSKGFLSQTVFYNKFLIECDSIKCNYSTSFINKDYNFPKFYTKTVQTVVVEKKNFYLARKQQLELMIKVGPEKAKRRGLFDELRLLKDKDTKLYKVVFEEKKYSVDNDEILENEPTRIDQSFSTVKEQEEEKDKWDAQNAQINTYMAYYKLEQAEAAAAAAVVAVDADAADEVDTVAEESDCSSSGSSDLFGDDDDE